jgi:hypothetical protein
LDVLHSIADPVAGRRTAWTTPRRSG